MNQGPQTRIEGRISVALCTFNGEQHLAEQLHSIASQTRSIDELVICDDGSSDASIDIIKAFASEASFPVRMHINSDNLGSSRNFEQAIQRCTGDFIALCDQDDVWLPRKIEVLSGVLENDPNLGGVFSDGELIDDESRELSGTLWNGFEFGAAQQKKFVQRGATAVLISGDLVTGATLMVRANLRPTFLPFPRNWIHDGWIAWMLASYAKLGFSSQRLIRYRVHSKQQVGVGAISLAQRIQGMRSTTAQDYLKRAEELEVLREHILSNRIAPCDPELPTEIQGGIAHCRRRAAMPTSFISRVATVLGHFEDYRKYSRTCRSMCKDVLVPV
jgi:glycosyltransferase involved in cell wall biosynthesis